jgi:3-methyladenine DNA glycosylase/8-oxoguanine DNA glycosylase
MQVIRVPPSFSLATAVCSYGFFMLAPNRWLRESSTFERPLHTLASGPVRVRVTQEAAGALRMTASATLSTAELEDLRRQVVRMLRLAEADFEAVAAFQALHAAARAEGFGHLLRSPSMWEDAVKSITLCNCGWGRTLGMNAALCGELGGGAFPTPAQVIAAGPEALQSKCGVGYRARTICALAQQVLDGTAAALEQQAATGITSDELHKGLLRLAGMGPFTGANMLELLGRFDRVPCDTETARHLAKAHGVSGGVSDAKKLQAAAQRVYAAYAPYQFLAYWFEIRQDYDALFGSLVDMDPADYAKATGAAAGGALFCRQQLNQLLDDRKHARAVLL